MQLDRIHWHENNAHQNPKKDINEIAQEFVNIDNLSDEDKNNKDKVVATAEDAIQGALDIIAENISDNAKYRKYINEEIFDEHYDKSYKLMNTIIAFRNKLL